MAVLGSLLFNRTLRQFLECQDLSGKKGIALTNKLKQSAKDSLSKILATIPETTAPHSDILKSICLQHAEEGGNTEELFLDSLEDDVTSIRATAVDILSKSGQINHSKLFKRLHETNVSKTEIIDILAFQQQHLKPEQVVINALKLDKNNAERLLKMAANSEKTCDLSVLNIDPANIQSPTLKILLLRFFARQQQPEVAAIIGKFLTDSNKTVVIEALKALKALSISFEASILLPAIETMSDTESAIAFEILERQADAELLPDLAGWVTSKNDDIREFFCRLVVRHATEESFEKFLNRLDKQEWWGRDQALKSLQNMGNDRLFKIAASLVKNDNEFVRSTAQQLSALSIDPADLAELGENALHENWQVRVKAIESLGKSGRAECLGMLKPVIEKYPESAVAVIKAARNLGFNKGLEIVFPCLKMTEAMVQREALEAIGELTSEKYAEDMRSRVLKFVPRLQVTVRDTAEKVVNHLTDKYNLKKLDVQAEDYFDTSLIKQSHNTLGDTVLTAVKPAEATVVVNFKNIEELKEGDLWMERFRIRREVGRGAMGRVMLAEDEMVGEPLILKFMHPELTADGASRERFLREVKYSRKVSHLNVIRIHDMLFKDNLCAISMEYFQSRGIDELLRQVKSIDAETGLDFLFQASDGMAAAHKQQVIHRDLKPSNILVNEKGLIKVVDFGIASASASTDSTLTKTGSIIGTPAYLSPERAKGLEAHYRCDIYAMGIIAYHMFVGHLPYRGEPMSMLFQHLEGNAKPMHEVNKSISPHLSRLVQKMMAVDPEKRIQTMDDLKVAILETKQKL